MNQPIRRNRIPGVAKVIACFILGAALAWATPRGSSQQIELPEVPAESEEQQTEKDEAAKSGPLMREGTLIKELRGYFRITGDRVTFFTSDDSERFVGLENLNLQRILQVIRDNPTSLEWKVTGVVTEFGGDNYLLIQRVILLSGEEDGP